ncbi:unnamed protein product, partial [Phaeothamnion confervicola]
PQQAVIGVPSAPASSTVVVWYSSCDLRCHDHEGLISGATAAAVIPLFVIDPSETVGQLPTTVRFILQAISDLRSSLREKGSDLVVRMGAAAEQLDQIVRETNASAVYYHASPVHALRQQHAAAEAALAGRGIAMHAWQTQLTASAASPTAAASNPAWDYRDFPRGPICAPWPAPERLPPLPPVLAAAPGAVPMLDAVTNDALAPQPEAVQRLLRETADLEVTFGARTVLRAGLGERLALKWLDEFVMEGEIPFGQRLFGPEALEDVELLSAGGGEGGAQLGLDAAATARIIKARGVGGLAPGEVFARAFGMALALGCLSPRRVAAARRRGFAPNALTVQRPLFCHGTELVRSLEWHDALAQRDIAGCSGRPFKTRYWRWNGWLGRYAVGGRLDDPTVPALIFVHGFGASVDQFVGCFEELGDRYRLFAIDLIGFGHSIKPPLCYTQYLWADQVRDFALEVVKGPFFVAGNSIGGFISMTVAAGSPGLCRGVVLINSAGRLLTPEQFAAEKAKFGGLSVADATRAGALGAYRAPPNPVLTTLSQGIFLALQGRIPQTLKGLYPAKPDVLADGRTANNILRDSNDPGAVGIFAAGAKLPFSASANELLGRFNGPVLVTQGILDPLNDARTRADMFAAVHPLVRVDRIEAGHCPHEENASEVCASIARFIDRVVQEPSAAV